MEAMEMRADTGFVVANGFDPSAIIEQIGGWGIIGIIVALVVVIVVVKIVFSILRKVIAVVVTLALTGALGGGILGLVNGWFGKVPDIFNSIFDNMPWS